MRRGQPSGPSLVSTNMHILIVAQLRHERHAPSNLSCAGAHGASAKSLAGMSIFVQTPSLIDEITIHDIGNARSHARAM